jgi:nucleoside triphosphate pyrophosphatase
VHVPEVQELRSGPPHEVAVENAYRKAAAVAPGAAEARVLGVDTVVSIGTQIYGKPDSEAGARATLKALGGRTHAVISGLCLIEAGDARTAATTTVVELRPLDDRLIDWYIRSGEWRERAGAYAIQGRGGALVSRIDGDYLNVVGLPVATLLELLPGLLTA